MNAVVEERFRIAGELAREEYESLLGEVMRGARAPVDFEDVDVILDKAQLEADYYLAENDRSENSGAS